ncbi:MAG: RIP metalloprotease RseP [Longicatena sp.]
MGTVLNIIYFVLILSAIIIVHELGHLIAAKRFGVYCKEFSIGMGPIVWQRQKGETAWSIRALPIGGFVAMAGESGEEEDDEDSIPYERTINGIKVWKQIIIMAAGAIMNILLAWALFIGITAYQGAVSVPGKPVIGSVNKSSPAQVAGMKAGDEIVELQHGETIVVPKTFSDVQEFMQYYPGTSEFSVKRDNEIVKLTITPEYVKSEGMYLMGVVQDTTSHNIKKISLLESIPYGTDKMVTSVTSIFDALGKLVKGIGLNNLSGPVGIYNVTTQITKDGLLSSLALVGLLSVNVGIFNLLPIPILDGGRIFIILIETLIGRKLSERVQNAVMMAGMLALIGIMVFATWNDIVRLFM